MMVPSEHEVLIALADKCQQAAEQIEAAMRATYGLPLAAIQSDTHEGKIGLWCDNGMAGIGQVAVFTNEFPEGQARGICALVNNAAGLAGALPQIAAALRARVAPEIASLDPPSAGFLCPEKTHARPFSQIRNA